jgi:hypothetical protein
MGVPRFFKLPQHKRFEYSPLYYDERKEEIEKIKQKYNTENSTTSGTEKNAYRPNIKGQMRNYYAKNTRASRKTSTIRLLVIILFLLSITYYLLFY